jgi:uncharacterized spore protein YtfJ
MDTSVVSSENSNVVERLAERLGSADARTVYGAPIERDGTTIIPVARIRYGFGGGSGVKASEGHRGGGAGGGANIAPVGYIELRNGVARFRRIRATEPALMVLGFGAAAWLLSRAIERLLPRRFRR